MSKKNGNANQNYVPKLVEIRVENGKYVMNSNCITMQMKMSLVWSTSKRK